MSATAGQAVFLSYASQDAEAARRICEALCAAGVEVWFDQSELVGGDAWDQKIRKQIRDCTLLIPVISAGTQARTEGYFRLEWRLADQRTHLMAKGRPFLLPVVIDATRDAEAHVPDSFLEVQWTRLPGGEVTPAFAARVKQLLDGNVGRDRPIPAPSNEAGSGNAAQPRSGPKWLKPILASAGLVIAVLALTLWKSARPQAKADATPIPPSAAPATPPAASPGHELIAKATILLRGLDATREDFALAEEYCQRALKLDPDDAEAWAIYSQVHAAFGYRGWDTSSERREQTRLAAERAIRLAPHSVEARVAQAGTWAAFGINRDEREQLLRDILREQPDNQAVLRFLSVTVLAKPGGLEECLALNERSAALPGGDALALFNNARYLWMNGRPADGYATLQRALAQRKFVSALVLKMAMEISWRGDLAAAEETLRQVPPAALLEDRANYEAGLLRYYQRNAAAAREIWQAFPRDFYADFVYDGPKGFLLGLADELDHRETAMRTEWRAALLELGKKIAAAPSKPGPYYHQAFLLACLGDKPAANEALRTHEELAGVTYPSADPMPVRMAQVYARLGRFDEIFAHPAGESVVVLKVSPHFDALRADPRFASWAHGAGAPAGPTSAAPAASAPVDEKSVAVLAFANLSADKDNEYFSDGISEELLNVLAKIPELKVAARTSAFYFKGREVPVPEIARQLGVAYVVEGSVRKAGDKVRITAQLVKASNGFHVWSDTFTRDLKDIFGVQDEIAGVIAKNLEIKMGFRPVARETIGTEAYQQYLVGRAAAAKAGMADLREAVTHFERAVALEPKYAAAWVQLATAHVQLGRWGGTPARQAWTAARTAIDHALALDPDSPDVQLALGWILRTGEWNWRGAEQAFRRALELRPTHADTLAATAVLLFNLGHKEEAFRLGQQAAQLDPLNAATQIDLGLMFFLSENGAESERAVRRALRLAPEGAGYRAILSWSLALQQRYGEAEAEIARISDDVDQATSHAMVALIRGQPAELRRWRDRLEELALLHPDAADLQQNIAWADVRLGETERAFAALEKTVALRDPSVAWFRGNWPLRPLEADPRWDALLRQVGLADDQLK